MFGPEVLSSFGLIGVLLYVMYCNNGQLDTDKLKFSGLLLWNVFTISLISEFLSLICGILFYFDFINTIAVIVVLFIMGVYGLLNHVFESMKNVYHCTKNYFTKNNLSNNVPENTGNFSIFTKAISTRVYKCGSYVTHTYILPYTKTCLTLNRTVFSYLYNNTRVLEAEKYVKVNLSSYVMGKIMSSLIPKRVDVQPESLDDIPKKVNPQPISSFVGKFNKYFGTTVPTKTRFVNSIMQDDLDIEDDLDAKISDIEDDLDTEVSDSEHTTSNKSNENTVREVRQNTSDNDDLNINESNINESDVNDLDINNLDVNESDVNESDMNESNVNDPDINDPDVNNLDGNDLDNILNEALNEALFDSEQNVKSV